MILALKAHFLEGSGPRHSDAMLGPETMIVTVQNGMPWWYFHKLGGAYDGHRLKSLDPSAC